ncbi:hypothetical protein Lal_00015083, partial [Lupinus albus]
GACAPGGRPCAGASGQAAARRRPAPARGAPRAQRDRQERGAQPAPAHHVPGRPPRLRPPRGNRAGADAQPGRDRVRRNRLGQDDAAAEDLPGTGPRRKGHDRPHAAAPHRRVVDGEAHRARTGFAAGRARGLQGPLQRHAVAGRLGQADDGRYPAGRDADRPAAQGLRHDHHRRGARAQPEHRLPARLPEGDPAAPAGPEGDHHVRDDRRRPLRAPFRHAGKTRARHRSVGPPVQGRGAVPPRRTRPGVRAGRRRQVRRRPRVPARRARDPRLRGGAAQAPSAARGNPAAVRAPLGRGAGPRVQDHQRAPHRPRDECGRDLADGAGHPLRRRRGPGARKTLQLPQQGRATADRGDLAGGRQPARGPLRPRGGRRLHPFVRGRRFPAAPEIHGPGNPALVAGGRHPAHEVPAPDGRGDVPVRRTAAGPRHRRRLPAAAGAGRRRRRQRTHRDGPQAGQAAARPARGPHDPGRRRQRVPHRDADHRVRAVRAGPARPPDGIPAAGRRKAQEVRGREERIPLLPEDLALVRAGHRAQEDEPPAAGKLPRKLPVAGAPARVARRAFATAHDREGAGLAPER